MEVITSGVNPGKKTAMADTVSDLFSTTLAVVVKDPSILRRKEEQPDSGAAKATLGDTGSVTMQNMSEAAKDTAQQVMGLTDTKTLEDSGAIAKNQTDTLTTAAITDSLAKAANRIADIKPPISNNIIKNAETDSILPGGKHTANNTGLQSLTITRLLSNKSDDGTEMVYVDQLQNKSDTIALFIPLEKNEQPGADTQISTTTTLQKDALKAVDTAVVENSILPNTDTLGKNKNAFDVDTLPAGKAETKDNAPKFIDIELPNPNAKIDTTNAAKLSIPQADTLKAIHNIGVNSSAATANDKLRLLNSDCKNFATDDDFLKLRKKMVSESSDDDMVNAARKVFRTKCFTTEQAKNLSVLFLKDDGKYKFFEAAYPFVVDSYNFPSLETQLTDDYYITRFKAMIRH
ncbi:MAG: DUF4476 domain-containing protein [Bacteroidetes bacterium]|nr:DUF4476 domain-containing protein [Bacteroidota bacterium]